MNEAKIRQATPEPGTITATCAGCGQPIRQKMLDDRWLHTFGGGEDCLPKPEPTRGHRQARSRLV
jgi:hypothetical protein